jgi:hypothetical protein
MTKRGATGKLANPIEAVFDGLEPYAEYSSPLQTRERSLIRSEVDQRMDELFRLYKVARTGDDGADFPKLAFQIITPRTLRRMMAEGSAPKCVQLGKRRHGFRLSAIDCWLSKRERGSA